MYQKRRSSRFRQLQPSSDSLEGRELLNAAMPQHVRRLASRRKSLT